MNSRERLLTAIKLGKTDRVPISTYELVGYNSDAFENKEPSYKRLMDHIREKTDCICMWDLKTDPSVAGTSCPELFDYEKIRGENYTDTISTLNTPKGELTSIRRVFDDVVTSWEYKNWCADTDDVDKIMSIPFKPLTYDDSDYKRIKEEVGDRGIIMASVGDPACIAMFFMEFGDAMVWAMTQTDHFAKTMDEMHRRNMINIENMLKTRVVDLYRICGPEVITPPYLPPEYFSRFVKPYLKEIVELIHSYGGLARIHCHGRIGKVLDDILECGANGLDPCEAPPDGDITLGEIKQRVDGRLCIFGNLQLKLLEKSSKSEVRDEVIRCMDAAKKDGGYIIMPTAAPINIPLSPQTEENYMTFIDTALEYGQY